MEGMHSENLLALKDDMIAFIEGHGMRHFPAVIPEDTPRVWWNDPDSDSIAGNGNESLRESWKDFVEMAKAAGAPMVCIGEDVLDKTTLELLVAELQEMSSAEAFGPEMEKLDSLSLQVGKVGHIELAFAHQGILFVHESATEWYRHYRQMVDTIDSLQELIEKAYGDDADEEQA
jgi:hypothetical protein